MRLENVLSSLNSTIDIHNKLIIQLSDKKQKLEKLKELVPNAHYYNGAICLPDIWDKISCMRIERKHRYMSNYTDLTIKLSVGKKHFINGTKLYTYPTDNIIARVFWGEIGEANYSISVYDFDKIINDACSYKHKFLNRIKLYIVNEISRHKLSLNDDCEYKDEINKLLMLR